MVRLTRLNQLPVVVNSDLIEHIEMNPDTVIALTTGQKILVRETADEIIERIVGFRHAVLGGRPAERVASVLRDRDVSNAGNGEGLDGPK